MDNNRARDFIGLTGLARTNLIEARAKLTPHVREKAAQALAQANGDVKAAQALLAKWAKRDDALWRQLREPEEPRGYRPRLLAFALTDASGAYDALARSADDGE